MFDSYFILEVGFAEELTLPFLVGYFDLFLTRLTIILNFLIHFSYHHEGGSESKSTFPKSSAFSKGGRAKPCEFIVELDRPPIIAWENGGRGVSLNIEVGVAGALTLPLPSVGCSEAIRVSELKVRWLGCLIQSSKGVLTPKLLWEWLVNCRCGNGEYNAISKLFALSGSSGLYNSSSAIIVWWPWSVKAKKQNLRIK